MEQRYHNLKKYRYIGYFITIFDSLRQKYIINSKKFFDLETFHYRHIVITTTIMTLTVLTAILCLTVFNN